MSDELEPGAEFGEFTIEELIGEGGMGLVYRALQGGLDRRVALKVITPRLSQDSTFRDRFRREARRAAAVDHPSIVPIYGAGEIDGRPYLAMRFIPGTDLGSLLKREGPIAPGGRALAIADQIAGALDAAHADGLIHRDVKPANILVEPTPNGERAYLTDFGLTRGRADTNLTRTGTFMGSPLYMSPEQIQGGELDARSDQYSLACVLYESLAGVPPFLTEGQLQAIYAHLHTAPPKLTATLTQLPPAVDDVLARGLAKTPAERYGSCQELIDAFRRAAALPKGGTAGTGVGPGGARPAVVDVVPAGSLALPRRRSQTGHRRRTLGLVAGAAVLVAVIAVVVVLAASGSSGSPPTGSTTTTKTARATFPPATAEAVLQLSYQSTQGNLAYTVVNGSQSGTFTFVFNQTYELVSHTTTAGAESEWLLTQTGYGQPLWVCDKTAGRWTCLKPAQVSKPVRDAIENFDSDTVNLISNGALEDNFQTLASSPPTPKVTTARQAGITVGCFSGRVDGGRRTLCVSEAGLPTQIYLAPSTGTPITLTATKAGASPPTNAFARPGPYQK